MVGWEEEVTDHVRAAHLRLEFSASHFAVAQLVLHALYALHQAVVLLLGFTQRRSRRVETLLQDATVVLAAGESALQLCAPLLHVAQLLVALRQRQVQVLHLKQNI